MPASGWVDVTDAVRRGVSGLRLGEILARPDFNVDQAISAIEIGDLRMDQPLTTQCHLPSLLASGRMPTDLTLGQVAVLIDALMFRLVHWWTGRSLQQTLHTVLYFRLQDELASFPLLAACTGLVTSIVSITRDIIQLGGVIMEEDCPLAAQSPDDPGMHPVDSGLLREQLSAALSTLDEATEQALADAVRHRLLFLQHLKQALLQMLQVPRPHVDRARATLERAAAELRNCESSSDAALSSIEAPGICPELARVGYAMPPPPLAPLPHATARAQLHAAVEQLTAVCEVAGATSLGGLTRLVDHLARICTIPVSRGVLFLLLSPQPPLEADEASPWALSERHYLQQLCLPSELVSGAPMLRLFLEQAHIAASNYLVAACMNRPRMHRQLRKGFDDWDRLRQHAVNADACPQLRAFLATKRSGWSIEPGDPGPCIMWIHRLTSACMLEYLFLGLELSLYNSVELPTVFWYCDYLLNIQLQMSQQFQRIRPKQYKTSGKKAKNKPEADRVLTNGELQSLRVEHFRMSLLELRRHFCQATLKLAVALHGAGIVLVHPPPYGSAKKRFMQRFECFQALEVPSFMEYEHVQRCLDPGGLTARQLLELPLPIYAQAILGAEDLSRQVRLQQLDVPEWELAETQALGMVAKRNATACRLLLQGQNGDTAERMFRAEWDFTHHQHFPSVVLKRR